MQAPEQVERFLETHSIKRDANLLLACSGGLDSMVLLHILNRLGFRVSVVHCNFKLRGDESDGDQAFVEKQCRELGRPLHTQSFDTAEYARAEGISTQMAARELRYNYFKELMLQHKYTWLLTAHHADDSLETLLINIGRGTGINGLQGIKAYDSQQKIVRPMHELSRKAIQEWAVAEHVEWHEDSSNASKHYQRNAIRHTVIPALKEAIPGFEQAWQSTHSNLKSDLAFFHYAIEKELGKRLRQGDGIQKFNLKGLDKAYIKTVLHAWLRGQGSFDLDAIYRALDRESGAVFFTDQQVLLKDRDFLILKDRKRESQSGYTIEKDQVRLEHPFSMQCSLAPVEGFEISASPLQAALDYDRLKFPLSLRHWKEGDRFQPLGMQSFKKLSDFFTDLKLSRFEKDEVWLLCSGDDIVWVIGYRIDNRYKVTDMTKTVYFADLLN